MLCVASPVGSPSDGCGGTLAAGDAVWGWGGDASVSYSAKQCMHIQGRGQRAQVSNPSYGVETGNETYSKSQISTPSCGMETGNEA